MSDLPAPQPLFSIGMPVYNGEEYLRQALNAVLAHDSPNLRARRLSEN